MKILIKTFLKNISGATAIEYSIITSLIGMSAIAGTAATGEKVRDVFCKVTYELSTQFVPGCRISLSADIKVDGPFSDSGIFLKEGQTVEIEPDGTWTVSQYNNTTDRQDDPFNSMNHLDPDSVSVKADFNAYDSSGNRYRMSAFGAQVIGEQGSNYDTNYSHDPGANMAIAQNGKVSITAAKDGYLYMGIHDDYAADNTFVGSPPRVSVFLVGEK